MANGQPLEELPVEHMLAVGYSQLIDRVTNNTEQAAEAREHLAKLFRDAEFEAETGLPAIAMRVPPADMR